MNTQQKLWIDACVADYAEQLSHSGGHSADDVARELAAYREELAGNKRRGKSSRA
jgi:hypothetical protein